MIFLLLKKGLTTTKKIHWLWGSICSTRSAFRLFVRETHLMQSFSISVAHSAPRSPCQGCPAEEAQEKNCIFNTRFLCQSYLSRAGKNTIYLPKYYCCCCYCCYYNK